MKIVSGVGLMLFDFSGKMLLLKELQSKVHYCKLAGMLSFPIETIEDGETSDQALERLIVEEVGVPIPATLSFFEDFLIRLNGTFTEKLYVYSGVCAKSFIARPTDTDIEYYGWMLPRKILELPRGQIRVEMEPVLWRYLAH
jgi:hypothetical protein